MFSRWILILFIQFVLFNNSYAAAKLNSYCYWDGKDVSPINGEGVGKAYPIASLTKVLTTSWVMSVLPPDFRFKTQVVVWKDSANDYNVHIMGGDDPSWGKQRLHMLSSELFKRGVDRIKKLSFDEKFILKWSTVPIKTKGKSIFPDFTETPSLKTSFPHVEEIKQSLKKNINPKLGEYAITAQLANQLSVEMSKAVSFKGDMVVEYRPSHQFAVLPGAKIYLTESLPLYQQLKLMNLTSNNYLADYYFELIGGADKFIQFHQHVLIKSKLNQSVGFQVLNGSGYPLLSGLDELKNTQKIYNQTSCSEVVAHLFFLQKLIEPYNLSLKDLLAVSGSDQSTLDKYSFPQNTVIAKTGTVDPAVNLAGEIKTQVGTLYFSLMYGTASSREWLQARAQIQKRVNQLVADNSGAKPIENKRFPLIYFDQRALLREM